MADSVSIFYTPGNPTFENNAQVIGKLIEDKYPSLQVQLLPLGVDSCDLKIAVVKNGVEAIIWSVSSGDRTVDPSNVDVFMSKLATFL